MVYAHYIKRIVPMLVGSDTKRLALFKILTLSFLSKIIIVSDNTCTKVTCKILSHNIATYIVLCDRQLLIHLLN